MGHDAPGHAEEGTAHAIVSNMTNMTMEDMKKMNDLQLQKIHDLQHEAGVMILGAVMSIMLFFYMVNCSSKLIRKDTWKMLNLSVSIFCAVLSYEFVNKTIELFWKGKHSHHGHGHDDHSHPGVGQIAWKASLFIGWWLFTLAILFLNRKSILKLQYHGTIAGHILGFATIYLFGDIALSSSFRDSPYMTLIVMVILFVSFIIIILLTMAIKFFLEKYKCMSEEETEAWCDQVKDTTTDFMAMGTAFLIVFFIRWNVLGEKGPPSIHGKPKANPENAGVLVAIAWGFLVCSALVAVLHHSLGRGESVKFVHTTITVSAAFLFIFADMWEYGDLGQSEVTSMTIIAAILTYGAIAYILFMSCIKDGCCATFSEAFRPIEMGFSMAAGLSWEKVFDKSLEGASEYIVHKINDESMDQTVVVLLTFVVLAIVTPAWALYILPKASDEIQEAMSKALKQGPLPLSALLPGGALELYDDAFESSDDEESLVSS